jgi:putative redox protein
MAETKQVALEWQRRDLIFSSDVEGKPPITVDGGPTKQGPSPVETLLLALAGCTGSDVVEILRKKRADLRSLRVEVRGERRDEHPRRYTAIALSYRIVAPGLAEHHARQAIDLSLEKYCSVTHSLAKDIPVRYELDLQA